MPKFRVTVKREDEFIIDIDPSKYTEKDIEDFQKSFFPAKNYRDIAKYVGLECSGDNTRTHLEGFGCVDIKYEGKIDERREGEFYAPGITVEVEYEREMDVEITELK